MPSNYCEVVSYLRSLPLSFSLPVGGKVCRKVRASGRGIEWGWVGVLLVPNSSNLEHALISNSRFSKSRLQESIFNLYMCRKSKLKNGRRERLI